MKETNLALSVNGVSLKHSQDSQWFDDVLAFLQEPEMVFMNNISCIIISIFTR